MRGWLLRFHNNDIGGGGHGDDRLGMDASFEYGAC